MCPMKYLRGLTTEEKAESCLCATFFNDSPHDPNQNFIVFSWSSPPSPPLPGCEWVGRCWLHCLHSTVHLPVTMASSQVGGTHTIPPNHHTHTTSSQLTHPSPRPPRPHHTHCRFTQHLFTQVYHPALCLPSKRTRVGTKIHFPIFAKTKTNGTNGWVLGLD
jgi:hypothetical protein